MKGLKEMVEGGLVRFDYQGAVNNNYYMPAPLAAPEKGHDAIAVKVEVRTPRKARKSRKSMLLAPRHEDRKPRVAA